MATTTLKTKISKDGKITISNPNLLYTIIAKRDGARMVRFAAAWCAPADKFKRKTGKAVCAEKFANGETMVAPLAGLNNDDLVFWLVNAFDNLA